MQVARGIVQWLIEAKLPPPRTKLSAQVPSVILDFVATAVIVFAKSAAHRDKS